MSQLLAGKKGVIFGALNERSLAWQVALRCMEEGAQIVLTNTEVAIQLGTVRDLASAHGLPLIVCDATNLEDIRDLFARAQELLGGQVDFVLHAVAQSTNLRRHKSYEEANYTYFQQTIDISALSLHKILHTAMDFIAALTLTGIWTPSTWLLEAIVAVFGILVFCGAYFLLYRKDKG